MSAVYVIGDVHGQYDKLARLLKNARLVDDDLRWTGGDAHLWFVGDFVDRGPDGIGVIELVMQLQNQAARAGGTVQALLGNHDLLLLSVYRFGKSRSLVIDAHYTGEKVELGTADFFTANWLRNGGAPADLARMTGKHAAWLSHLPAMARAGDKLLIHADALLYMRNGSSVDEVNRSFRQILEGDDVDLWDIMLDAFGEHRAFLSSSGAQRAARFLRIFDAAQIIHGHTPISKLDGQDASRPLVYANGRCVNVDGGMYLGGAGFVYQLD
jgi:hypothetical protein